MPRPPHQTGGNGQDGPLCGQFRRAFSAADVASIGPRILTSNVQSGAGANSARPRISYNSSSPSAIEEGMRDEGGGMRARIKKDQEEESNTGLPLIPHPSALIPSLIGWVAI